MAQIGGQHCDVVLDVSSGAVQVDHGPNGEGVPQVVDPRPVLPRRQTGSNSDPAERDAEWSVEESVSDRGDEEEVRPWSRVQTISNLGIPLQGRGSGWMERYQARAIAFPGPHRENTVRKVDV